ncbi:MAG: cytochrome c nitrite reductase small subunit [Chloroflexota bacterium]
MRVRAETLVPLLLALVAGVAIGLGSFTFVYARGYSYLSDEPTACVNCHVMRDNLQSWQLSSHRQVVCNGCHVPHDLAGKYFVKAEHGFAHSWAFTFTQPQNIRIKQSSLDVVQDNCIECHRDTIDGTFLMAGDKRCTKCHPAVGHAF